MKGVTVGVNEEDETLRATREYNAKVLEHMHSMDDAKILLQRTHAVTVSVHCVRSETDCKRACAFDPRSTTTPMRTHAPRVRRRCAPLSQTQTRLRV